VTPTPSDQQALEALRTLRAWLGLDAASRAPTTFDQDHLPPGTTRRSFLRRHAAHVRAGTSGWCRVGHGRTVTVEAWSMDVATETAGAHRLRPTRLEVVRDLDEEIDQALGIRVRKVGAR
jgi:hypothetical protein